MYAIFTDIDDSCTCRFAHLALVAWDISWLLKRNCQLGPPSKNQCITPTNRLGALLHLIHCSIQYCFAPKYLYSLSCFTVLYSYLASFTTLLIVLLPTAFNIPGFVQPGGKCIRVLESLDIRQTFEPHQFRPFSGSTKQAKGGPG